MKMMAVKRVVVQVVVTMACIAAANGNEWGATDGM
jgi:hypothetical protein